MEPRADEAMVLAAGYELPELDAYDRRQRERSARIWAEDHPDEPEP